MNVFAQWLDGQMRERNWSYNELARRAGVSSASVSMVMTGQQKPGVDFCRGVAGALNQAPEHVFRLAGLLPRKAERDEVVDEILWYFEQMTPESQAHFRLIARAFVEEGGGEAGMAPEAGSVRQAHDGAPA